MLVCSRSMFSGVLVGVPFGGVRYAGWKVVRCAELQFALHLAALVAAIVASHT